MNILFTLHKNCPKFSFLSIVVCLKKLILFQCCYVQISKIIVYLKVTSRLSNQNVNIFLKDVVKMFKWQIDEFFSRNFLIFKYFLGYDMSPFVRRYAKYLSEKSVSYRTVAFDFCKVRRGWVQWPKSKQAFSLKKYIDFFFQLFFAEKIMVPLEPCQQKNSWKRCPHCKIN